MCVGKMWKFITFFGLLTLVLEVRTVKITKLSVPSQFILNTHKPEHLVLDCEYEIEPHEKGLVLKWFLNSQPVYQWIPQRQPFGLKGFKNRVNTTYSVSAEHLHKYRAMAVTKPMWNHTGEYSCWVQTFESNDRKTANVTVIVPESDFHLQYRTDHEGIVHIRCNVYNISPEPRLSVILGNDRIVDGTLKSTQASNGLFITSRHIKIPQSDIHPESNINCILSIPKTNYTRRKEVVYFEQPIPSDPSEHEIEDFSSPVFSLGPFYHNGCEAASKSRGITSFIPFIIQIVNILILVFKNNNNNNYYYRKIIPILFCMTTTSSTLSSTSSSPSNNIL